MIQLGRVLARLRLVATPVAVPKKIAMAVEKEFGRKGKLFDPSKVRLRLGRPNECHKNSSKLFYLDQERYQLCSGQAYVDEVHEAMGVGDTPVSGMWVEHTWLLEKGRIVDTTNIYQQYFGVVLTQREAIAFAKNEGMSDSAILSKKQVDLVKDYFTRVAFKEEDIRQWAILKSKTTRFSSKDSLDYATLSAELHLLEVDWFKTWRGDTRYMLQDIGMYRGQKIADKIRIFVEGLP